MRQVVEKRVKNPEEGKNRNTSNMISNHRIPTGKNKI